MPTTIPNLWFDGNAEEAAELYVSVFPNSKITKVFHFGDAGPGAAGTVCTVEFELDGQPYIAINGGPQFRFTEAVSFGITCADQAEVDHYWTALTADGGEEGPCGWLKDRFGLSWQVVPEAMNAMLDDVDPARSDRVMQAMFPMHKLDVATLQAAADRA